MTAIDNLLLFRCIQLIRRIQRTSQNVGFFCNVAANTIQDEEFFGDFVDYLENNMDLAPNLVFEFSQADVQSMGDTEARLLGRLATLGCRISMDRVSDLNIDTDALTSKHVSFVKIDVALLLIPYRAQEAKR